MSPFTPMGRANEQPGPFSFIGPSALNPETREYERVRPLVIDDGQFEREIIGGGLDCLPTPDGSRRSIVAHMRIHPIVIQNQPTERGGDLPLLISIGADGQRTGGLESGAPHPDELGELVERLPLMSEQ